MRLVRTWDCRFTLAMNSPQSDDGCWMNPTGPVEVSHVSGALAACSHRLTKDLPASHLLMLPTLEAIDALNTPRGGPEPTFICVVNTRREGSCLATTRHTYTRGMLNSGVTRICVDVFEVIVPVDVLGAGLADAVAVAWHDAISEKEPTVPPVTVAVGLDAAAQIRGGDIDEALHFLSPAITLHAIAARAGQLVMLHAAALADPQTGATAVLVAASGTGKTTAARILGGQFIYLSDETAAITHHGRVLAHRKPLSIIETPGKALKTQLAASALGLDTSSRDCRLGALVVIERAPDHPDTPTVNRLEPVDAIAAIAPQTSYLPSLDRPLHRLAEVIDLAGGAHHVT